MAHASWMSDHWEELRHKALMELTFPGSHHSGNYQGGLSASRLCHSDYRYQEYLDDPSTQAAEATLTKEQFDAGFIPWNVNHHGPISSQLADYGVRFFHLKICNFGDPGAAVMDLSNVVFQHRGYTTQETLEGTLSDMQAFLATHPKEVIVLGLNNLHNAASHAFGDADISALGSAVVAKLGTEVLVTKEELSNSSLGDLVAAGRRFAVFLGGSEADAAGMPQGLIPSKEALTENWSDVMKSGSLGAAAAWLVDDARLHGTQQEKFYVLQANPNDSESRMYARLNDQGAAGPQSLEEWLTPFLKDLGGLIRATVEETPAIRINAVSTDFLGTSKPLQIALSLMGLPVG